MLNLRSARKKKERVWSSLDSSPRRRRPRKGIFEGQPVSFVAPNPTRSTILLAKAEYAFLSELDLFLIFGQSQARYIIFLRPLF